MSVEKEPISDVRERLNILSDIELAVWIIGTIEKEKGSAEVNEVKYVSNMLRQNVDWDALLKEMGGG